MMKNILSNTVRSRQAILIFKLLIASFVVAVLNDILYISYLESPNGEDPEGLDLVVTTAQGFIGLGQVAINILAVVYFLRWFRRAYANLSRAGIRTDHTEGWAAGAWFVPFMNWTRPYSIMREIWWGTQRLAGRAGRPFSLLGWWWAAFLVHGCVGRASDQMLTKAETPVQIINATWADFYSGLFAIVSAVITLVVIQRVAAVEAEAALQQQVALIGQPSSEPEELMPTEPDAYF
jgi:hypothetical protein